MSFVALLVLPKLGLADASDKTSVAAYLVMWGIFTLVMFIGTLKANRVLQLVFGTLTILFFLLALGDVTGNGTITLIAGYEGILCGFIAMYGGLAQVLNEMFKKTVAPIG
jgi:succinate-acetate transporter protein